MNNPKFFSNQNSNKNILGASLASNTSFGFTKTQQSLSNINFGTTNSLGNFIYSGNGGLGSSPHHFANGVVNNSKNENTFPTEE